MINIIWHREMFIRNGTWFETLSHQLIQNIQNMILNCYFPYLNRSRKRYSPEKTDGERELEDLRSRLLSKRSKQDIERKIEEHQMNQRK